MSPNKTCFLFGYIELKSSYFITALQQIQVLKILESKIVDRNNAFEKIGN